jgi:hypothetical protein
MHIFSIFNFFLKKFETDGLGHRHIVLIRNHLLWWDLVVADAVTVAGERRGGVRECWKANERIRFSCWISSSG